MAEPAEKPALAQRTLPRSYSRSWLRRLIMPLIVLAFAAGLLYFGREREARQEDEVHAAVRLLIDEVAASPVERPTPGPVAQRLNASSGVLERIARFIHAHPPGLPGFDIQVEDGDAPSPFGDGSATHRALINVHGQPEVGLRLHHPGDAQRIEVLGFWTPQHPVQ